MHTFLDHFDERHRGRLTGLSREVSFPAGERLFEERRRADRFWVLLSGGVQLELQAPGRPRMELETLGDGDLVGWSWLCPPYLWTLGARTRTPVHALEFDAERVRAECEADPAFGYALVLGCAAVLGRRLHTTRTRLVNLYAPQGSGSER